MNNTLKLTGPAATAEVAVVSMAHKRNSSIALQRLILGAAIILIGVAATVLNDAFLSWSNVANIGRAVAVIGIVCVGQAIVLLTENIDLSVGSVAALAGVALVGLQDLGPLVSVVGALLIGVVVGLFHGVVRVWSNVSPLVITLATMTGIRGVVLVLTQGQPQTLESSVLTDVLWADVAGVPVPVLILGIILVGMGILLSRTRFGTYIYAIGGSRSAAEKAGISYRYYIVAAFVLSSLAAATAGIMITARLATASPTAGMGWELQSIAAVVIGGFSLAGGRGDMVGAALGILLIGVINSAMNIVGIDAYFQQTVLGVLILLAVVASVLQSRRNRGT